MTERDREREKKREEEEEAEKVHGCVFSKGRVVMKKQCVERCVLVEGHLDSALSRSHLHAMPRYQRCSITT